MVHLEPTLHSLLLDVLHRDAETGSSYFRGLLIHDLQQRGLMPADALARLAGAR